MQQFYCKPQANAPLLQLAGTLLPTATQGVAYSQNIAGQASGGSPPYTFTLLSSAPMPGDTWFVSAAGVITGTPNTFNFRVDNLGNFRVDSFGNFRVTT